MPDAAAEARFNDMYAKLNDAQRTAVDTIDGPVMVVAGPGTGKTQTIALRIANILRQTQLNPENILCLTFTDSAANTMRRRLLSIIGTTAYDVRINTFHGFCNEVIQRHPEKFKDFGSNIEPLSDIDKFKIFSSLIDQLPFDSMLKPFGNSESYIWELPQLISGFKKDDISLEQIAEAVNTNIDFFNKTKEKFLTLKQTHFRQLNETIFTSFIVDLEGLGFADFGFVSYLIGLIKDGQGTSMAQLRNKIIRAYENGFTEGTTAKQQEFINLFKNYQQTLRDEGKYDYDDMIISVVQRFQSDKELLSEYQERFQYILVDEFQDTNSSQNEVLRLLGSFWADPNIFVVGDDDQSIFRFQGASVENMIFFYNTYLAKIKVISLTENYRSQQLILSAARDLIAHNGLQVHEIIPNLTKQLTAVRKDFPEVKINVLEFKDPVQESFGITERIKGLREQGVTGKEIAVITRDNSDQEDIIEALTSQKINYRLEKGENILANTEIQKLLTLLNYLINPELEETLFQIINHEYWGFDKFDLAKIFTYAVRNRIHYHDLLASEELLTKAGVADPKRFLDFSSNLLQWRQGIYNYNGLVYFNKLIRDTGFLDFILTREGNSIILNKLARLYQELKNLDHTKENYNLVNFIEDLGIYKKYGLGLVDKLWGIDNDDSIRIMTAHGAKGQEFEYVFIIKGQDRKWGSRSNQNKIRPPFGLLKNQYVSEEDDEERRLFYVAMTRTKKELAVSYSRFNNKQRENNPCKFLKEINPDYLNQQTMYRDDVQEAGQYLAIAQTVPEQKFSEQAQELLHNILSDFHLSVSNILAYRRCPRCFYFNSLLRVPHDKNKAAAFGSAVHSALKNFMDTFNQSGQLPSDEVLSNYFLAALRGEHLDETDYLEAMKMGETVLNDYYLAKALQLPKSSYNEYNLKHTEVAVEGIPISGKIDRIDQIDSVAKTLRVLDYKTGNPDSAAARLSVGQLGDYYLQLVFYKILLDNSHTIPGTVTEGVVEFLQKSRKDKTFISKTFTLTPEAIPPVIELIKSTYNSIMALDFTKVNPDTYNGCDTPEYHDLPWIF